MEKKEYYFSVLIQETEIINEIDELRDKYEEDDNFNICQYVADMFGEFADNPDNFTPYKPYICRGSDFGIEDYQEYSLIRNLAICGDYMLYRKATDEEVEWLNEYYN